MSCIERVFIDGDWARTSRASWMTTGVISCVTCCEGLALTEGAWVNIPVTTSGFDELTAGSCLSETRWRGVLNTSQVILTMDVGSGCLEQGTADLGKP
jgi:hypothetical protein